MKTILLIILFSLFTAILTAPPNNTIAVIQAEAIKPYEAILRAVGTFESKMDSLAFNPEEQARGYLQIRDVLLVEFNRQAGKHYSRKDLFNPGISKKVFLHFANQIGPYNIEKILRNWNGGPTGMKKPKTLYYYLQVKKNLKSN